MTSSPDSQLPDDTAPPQSGDPSEPIGQLLKRAGLLSDAQIQLALMDQSQHELMFGEILVMRGWLKPQTLRFFLDNFRRAQESNQHQPVTTPTPKLVAPAAPPKSQSPAQQAALDQPSPVPTLSSELSGFLDPAPEFEPLEVSTTPPEDLSKYLTSSPLTTPARRIPKPSAKRSVNTANGLKTNSRKIDGYALDSEDERVDLSFEEALTEAELRALLELD